MTDRPPPSKPNRILCTCGAEPEAYRLRTGNKLLADTVRSWGWESRAQESNGELVGRVLHEMHETVAALRAERDAAWNEVEREREKYKADMAALVEVARWSQRSGLQDAELTTLRAEVEKLREALEWSHSAFVAQRDQAPARKRLMALTIKNCRMAVVDIVAQSRAALKAPQP